MKEKLYNELAKYYDLFNFNDYQKQADFITSLINKYYIKKTLKRQKILDLACGTGEHIKLLNNNFLVEGADLNIGMIKIARKKNPKAIIKKRDLQQLQLPNTHYDVIICLSGSIQYILSSKKLLLAFKTIYRSLKKDGLFIFDLYYCKDKWIEGYVGVRTIVQDNLQIAEIFKSRSISNISYYNPIYLIQDHDKNQFFIDDHKIYLYKIKEAENILKRAGFKKVKIFGDYTTQYYNDNKHKTPVFIAFK